MKEKKLTVYHLIAFRLTNPNQPLSEFARRNGLSRQYVSILWQKLFPDMQYNETWGTYQKRTCKTCGKKFPIRTKRILKGRGKYCSLECRRKSIDK